MTGTCPTCGSAIDPLRAPVVRIVDGKIRGYCSSACADGAAVVAKVTAAAANASDALAKRAPGKPPTPSPTPVVIETETDVEDDAPRTAAEHRRRRNRRVLWLSAGIITGGMAVAVIQTVSPSSPARVNAEGDDSPPPERSPEPGVLEAPLDEPPAFDPSNPEMVRDRALVELRALLPAEGGKVTRIAREAARALSRTGDQAALDALARALVDEPAGFGRIELAYALARGGDARGTKDLVASLKSQSRDVRGDAAVALARLGDARGADVLSSMLHISQHRIEAAAALALLQDKRALALLEEVQTAEKSSREDRWRALVALGRAGRPTAAAELRVLVDQKEFKVGAAEALARLGDRAAVPTLVEDLGSPSLQVGAALGLRRIDPGLDPAPYLPGLVAMLDSGKDTAKVTAAEAILVLTGPPEIAERD